MVIKVTTTQRRTGIAYTRTAAVRTDVTDNVVGTSTLPYMRSISIQVKGYGLRPNVTYRPFFDDVDVSLECAPNIFTTDSAGTATGTFVIPERANMKFTTGRKNFMLKEDTAGLAEDQRSFAVGAFESFGGLVTRQKTYTTVRYVAVTGRRVAQNKSSVGYVDPIAQSFVVTHAPGTFIDSIDLYFANKDASLPVSCEIVHVESGTPQQDMIPFSKVSLPPSQVNVSADATQATNFKFDNPVYLEAGEYALVVKTNSNPSNKATYDLFYAKMGEPEILPGGSATDRQGKGIRKQPYAGVMFKSQNASTWTEDQMSDVKFRIHRVKFDITSNAKLSMILGGMPQGIYKDAVVGGGAGYEVTGYTIRSAIIDLPKTSTVLEGTIGSIPTTNLLNDSAESLSVMQFLTTLSDVRADVTLTSTDDYVSPIVDLEKSVAILTNHTWINEVDPTGAGFDYKMGTYISKPTKLDHDSVDLTVVLDVEQKARARADVYFMTSSYVPQYIDIVANPSMPPENSTFAAEFVDNTVYVYYYASATGTLSAPISQMTITEATLAAGGVHRYYVKGVSDRSTFQRINPTVPFYSHGSAGTAGTGQVWDTVLISNEGAALLPGDIPLWDAATPSYPIGTIVRNATGEFFEFMGIAGGAGNTTSAPTTEGTAWTLIQTIKIVDPASGSNALIEDNVVQWQDTILDPTIKLDAYDRSQINDIREVRYVPKRKIESAFTTFQVKIVMRSTAGDTTPDLRNLRVISTR